MTTGRRGAAPPWVGRLAGATPGAPVPPPEGSAGGAGSAVAGSRQRDPNQNIAAITILKKTHP